MTPPLILVIMGVSGAGKTTFGRALASQLGLPFEDADDYHPPANVEKMKRGEPLNDEDRVPWLEELRSLIAAHLRAGGAVLACSALKQSYRDRLAAGQTGVVFIYLQGSFESLHKRLQQREGHFMHPSLLRSQFTALEEPANAIVVDALSPLDKQLHAALSRLPTQKNRGAS